MIFDGSGRADSRRRPQRRIAAGRQLACLPNLSLSVYSLRKGFFFRGRRGDGNGNRCDQFFHGPGSRGSSFGSAGWQEGTIFPRYGCDEGNGRSGPGTRG